MDTLGINIFQDTLDVCLINQTDTQPKSQFVNQPIGFTQWQRWLNRHQVKTCISVSKPSTLTGKK